MQQETDIRRSEKNYILFKVLQWQLKFIREKEDCFWLVLSWEDNTWISLARPFAVCASWKLKAALYSIIIFD